MSIYVSGGRILGSGGSIFSTPGGGTLPGAPTALTQNLQGQTVAFQNSASAPTPSSPNSQSFFFTQSSPAAGRTANGNVVYRSTTSATAGFAPIINTSSFTINGLAGAGTGPLASAGSIAQFTDSNATKCVGSTNGSQTQPPTVYYSANTYWYRVTLVDDLGQESAKSPTQQAILYWGGTLLTPSIQAYIIAHGADRVYSFDNMGADFNTAPPPVTLGAFCATTYNSTNGSPQSGSAFVIQCDFGGPSDFGVFLPVFSGAFSTWNYWAGAYTSLQYDWRSTTSVSSGDYSHEAVMSGDVHLTNASGGNNAVDMPSLPANTWQTVVWPFTTILKDFGASPYTNFVIQYAMYKWGIESHLSTASTLYFDRMLLPGTP